jgi:small subunit ribosomal protein S16
VVVIRLRVQGRKHRAFYRICAMDKRQPNDGRFIEELGTYDPQVRDRDKGVTMKADRVRYWLSVGAQPSERCKNLFDRYLKKFELQAAAEGAGPAPKEGQA